MVIGLDLVNFEIVYSSLRSMVREMEALVWRTAMSHSFKDKRDYFIGVYDSAGRLVDGLLAFTGNGLIDPVLQAYPDDDIKAGDVFCFNDVYTSGGAAQHLPDIVVVIPIFDGPLRVGFLAAFGHVDDIGGSRYGSTTFDVTDIFQEGLAIPPIRVGTNFTVDEWFIRLLRRNTREPDLLWGDWRALLGACDLGAKRFAEVIADFGTDTLLDTIDWVIEETSARKNKLIESRLRDGSYEATCLVDVSDARVPRELEVNVKVTKSGSSLDVDLSASGDQVAAPINWSANLPNVEVLIVRLLMMLDRELPLNQGSLENIRHFETRPGSVVNPSHPAPTGSRRIARDAVVNCLSKIFSDATDGMMAAPMPLWGICKFAFPTGSGGPVRTFQDTLGVGLGGRPFSDGPDVIYFIGQRNYPVELVETVAPITIERYEIIADSGGAGAFRGGCGVERVFRLDRPGKISPLVANTSLPPQGMAGGNPGSRATVEILHPDGSAEEHPGYAVDLPVQAGEWVRIRTAGGGGWGDPSQRDRARISRDVTEHFVTVQGAARDYGYEPE